MRLVIARSNEFSYSETFIDAQITSLEPVEVLFDTWFPHRKKSGGSIYPFPLHLLIFRGLIRRLFPSLFQHMYHYYLKKYLQNIQADAVLLNYGVLGANLSEACLELSIPYSIYFLGFDAADHKTIKTYGQAYQKYLPKAKNVFIVSSHMKGILEKIVKEALPNIHYLPCGINTELFKPNPKVKKNKKSFQLISVARFAEKKGPLLSIQAFHKAFTQLPTIRLQMIGDGPMWAESKQLARDLGLKDVIEFLGPMKQMDYLPLLQNADLYLQHSITAQSGDQEGTPVSILEAAACGLPVISTIHAGIPEAVLNGKSGVLVEEKDIAATAEAILFLAKDENKCRQMGEIAREHMLKNYRNTRFIEEMKSKLL